MHIARTTQSLRLAGRGSRNCSALGGRGKGDKQHSHCCSQAEVAETGAAAAAGALALGELVALLPAGNGPGVQ